MKLSKVLCEMTLPELEYIRHNLNLTDEESLVFNDLAKGKSIIAIADRTNSSPSTVSNRIRAIKDKLERL